MRFVAHIGGVEAVYRMSRVHFCFIHYNAGADGSTGLLLMRDVSYVSTPTEFGRWLGFVITLRAIIPCPPCLLIPDPYSGKIIGLYSTASAENHGSLAHLARAPH